MYYFSFEGFKNLVYYFAFCTSVNTARTTIEPAPQKNMLIFSFYIIFKLKFHKKPRFFSVIRGLYLREYGIRNPYDHWHF